MLNRYGGDQGVVRKYLKEVGVTAQQAIERVVRDEKLAGKGKLKVKMVLTGEYPYGAPPAVVVPHIVPVVPPAIAGEPVIVVPRPTSCGEYRYWNGQNCVDARYNRPYLGPRP